MCGRLDVLFGAENLPLIRAWNRELTAAWREKEKAKKLTVRKSWNVAPTSRIPVGRMDPADGEFEWLEMRWGFPANAHVKGAREMINARAETVAQLRTFKKPFALQRCLVPASGYYEWMTLPDGTKQPFHICRRDGEPMILAGIWVQVPEEEWPRCCILTTGANGETSNIHNRMPVMLSSTTPGVFEDWLGTSPLSGERAAELVGPFPEGELHSWPVSRAVNNVRNNGAELLERVGIG